MSYLLVLEAEKKLPGGISGASEGHGDLGLDSSKWSYSNHSRSHSSIAFLSNQLRFILSVDLNLWNSFSLPKQGQVWGLTLAFF